MRIDILSIFPDYLRPLDLSLPGKARAKGLLDIAVHDLRQWATDRHHTVDDTPYGGGAGMVMKPEPFGAAFDEIGIDGACVVFTAPSGTPFSQQIARDLATRERLVFACGRYEGIDQRVIDHAASRAEVREISIGDYVLNGGEVAALAITEAVVRLLPGFMGNAESLVEESHEDGLLEYPVYTKPATWRGHDVPDVLLSGNHGAIADWRRDQAIRRTAERRPDLLHGSATLSLDALDELDVRPASRGDAGELFTLQRACWLAEGQANPGVEIPALGETLDDVVAGLAEWTTHVVRHHGRLVGACRGRLEGDAWHVGRLMVAPDLQGRGLGRWLLGYAESLAPPDARRFLLFTGVQSTDNQRMYRKAGYRLVEGEAPDGAVLMGKPRR
ncbi:tRNA (guanosine(37)-N1)-methyltransferase TrmD [Nocardioides sp. AE5]|uniref:tRNA (guanosine(37)-N1)-methyltransferase TrmD n=1 Tax=Nocardioides sp. AE5 TaxID=2962573 RepID=UPI002881396C|nr:tRNA (guanosine(37)-N1)-methyltransferase TrmD [Nocardioides sp. AE5]MDT0203259.1 tRNA (guanosine(37)-N1)-methyltransferase TrmD [Nocardioides sp. AE5]